MRYITAKPAHGVDYITAQAVKDAWRSGAEFLIVDTNDYITKDTKPADVELRIRYDRNSSIVRIT